MLTFIITWITFFSSVSFALDSLQQAVTLPLPSNCSPSPPRQVTTHGHSPKYSRENENENENDRHHISNLHLFQFRLPTNQSSATTFKAHLCYLWIARALPLIFDVHLAPSLVYLVHFSRCSPSLTHPFAAQRC
ncbi:hypothetical protein DFJ58DRAFT_372330 [Suillus subalutaceus]|uniref:uncharacterized protein n=1 Tax=Suillus subalutaceus TaxID=48586 RepID=UPI001B8765CC|nr:uncharacterized protein DFJ58DRAFT_372330 [Suillus subalutaceus]KAG1854963.1 hypothetical protein DFJ58DRAFT_372330 [Suillus subalutaceus]